LNILVTGANGFIGKNLTTALQNQGYVNIYAFDRFEDDNALLDSYTGKCSLVFLLAALNRPEEESEINKGDIRFTTELTTFLEKHRNACPVIMTSSAHAEKGTLYGLKKKACEEAVLAHARKTGAPIQIYRVPNLFGEGCRPNFVNIVAEIIYNIVNGLEVELNPANPELEICYIDDLITELLAAMKEMGNGDCQGLYRVPDTYNIRLFEIADLIKLFKENPEQADMKDPFIQKLYRTYLSY
jgi:UDP-2-acetamido-2,6-beta-L-arabino-hexul-4-ose reductase